MQVFWRQSPLLAGLSVGYAAAAGMAAALDPAERCAWIGSPSKTMMHNETVLF